MNTRNSRGRNWTFVGYPEDSLPEDYASILSDELHLCWCESPVHDADLNGDGSEKKKHIHFIVSFEGNKSFEQIQEITEFCDLVEAVFQMDNNDWIDIITCRNTMFLSAYLKSRYYRSQQPERPALGQGILIDRLSGEEI